MNGTVISFDLQTGKGLIRGSDGTRFGFVDAEWLTRAQRPAVGQSVDFEVAEGNAKQIALLSTPSGASGAGDILSEARLMARFLESFRLG